MVKRTNSSIGFLALLARGCVYLAAVILSPSFYSIRRGAVFTIIPFTLNRVPGTVYYYASLE